MLNGRMISLNFEVRWLNRFPKRTLRFRLVRPLRTLCSRFEISDVALKKTCAPTLKSPHENEAIAKLPPIRTTRNSSYTKSHLAGGLDSEATSGRR
jgi:hypothetical protein